MNAQALASLKGGMWQDWQKRVEAAGGQFAKSPLYVEQDSILEEEFRRVATRVGFDGVYDVGGERRDVPFGARTVDTCFGWVTRMWLDSNTEIHFLYKYLPELDKMRVLDIGAGYGRLAVALEPHAKLVACVDAVPISTKLCRKYVEDFGTEIPVLSIQQFIDGYAHMRFDLAINIHSWNECTLEQVEAWLYVLVETKVPYLFTVAYSQSKNGGGSPYHTYELGSPSFRPAIERYYDLIAEECLGIENAPHALWKLKPGAEPVQYVPPQKPTVWIATPIKDLKSSGEIKEEDFNKLAEHYRLPVQALSRAYNLPFRVSVYLVGGGGVARARNKVVTDFLESDATYLFFFDYDLMPSPQDFVTIIIRMMTHGLLVCGGFYTIRQDNGHWVYNYPDAAGIIDGWALRVAELGTGFKCYHRAAFEQIGERNPWLKYEDDDSRKDSWGFFSMGPVRDALWPGKARWLTEDYWLDWLTRDAGIPIVVDTTIQLKHYDDATGKTYPNVFPPLPGKAPEGTPLVKLDKP